MDERKVDHKANFGTLFCLKCKTKQKGGYCESIGDFVPRKYRRDKKCEWFDMKRK